MKTSLRQRRPLADVEEIEVVSVVRDDQHTRLEQLSVESHPQPMVLTRQALECAEPGEDFAATTMVLAGVNEIRVQPE